MPSGTWATSSAMAPIPMPSSDRLRDLKARGVRGNHDLAATGDDVIRDFNTDARAAMEWTRRTIRPATLDWLAALPPRLTIDDWSLVHASPRDPTWEYIVTEEAAAANLAVLPTARGLFGHTHLPIAYFLADGSADDIDDPDPGSGHDDRPRRPAGARQPGQRRPAARRRSPGERARPRPGKQHVTWIRAEYDIAATQAAMRAVGLPARGISRLAFGI